MVLVMSWLDVVSVISVAILVVVALGMGRMGWRLWHNNEQMEAGGSMGDQMLGQNERDAGAFARRTKRSKK